MAEFACFTNRVVTFVQDAWWVNAIGAAPADDLCPVCIKDVVSNSRPRVKKNGSHSLLNYEIVDVCGEKVGKVS